MDSLVFHGCPIYLSTTLLELDASLVGVMHRGYSFMCHGKDSLCYGGIVIRPDVPHHDNLERGSGGQLRRYSIIDF